MCFKRYGYYRKRLYLESLYLLMLTDARICFKRYDYFTLLQYSCLTLYNLLQQTVMLKKIYIKLSWKIEIDNKRKYVLKKK